MELQPNQYKTIFYISFLSLGSSIYAVYNKYYILSLCPGGVFLTSINYWRKPDYSWRRYLDMTYVKFALCYQIYKAYRSQYMLQYYTIMFLAIMCYPVGIYYYNKKNYWHSTYTHCGLNILANIGNVVLYTGKIA